MKVKIRPAVPSDFLQLIDRLPPYRVRAFTGAMGDEVLGIGGIAYLQDGAHGVFLLTSEKAKKFPVTLHKAGLMVLREARRLGIRKLVTLADPHIAPAERWLLRLGFEQIQIGEEKVWSICLC